MEFFEDVEDDVDDTVVPNAVFASPVDEMCRRRVTHLQTRAWFAECVEGRAKSLPHIRRIGIIV